MLKIHRPDDGHVGTPAADTDVEAGFPADLAARRYDLGAAALKIAVEAGVPLRPDLPIPLSAHLGQAAFGVPPCEIGTWMAVAATFTREAVLGFIDRGWPWMAVEMIAEVADDGQRNSLIARFDAGEFNSPPALASEVCEIVTGPENLRRARQHAVKLRVATREETVRASDST